jgi:hypothetical protein
MRNCTFLTARTPRCPEPFSDLLGLPGHGGFAAFQLPSLRGWVARDRPGLMLAGANPAWHLGYLDRQPSCPTQIWLAGGVRLPDGLRPHVSVVALAGPGISAANLAPLRGLLFRRKLDLTRWAGGLDAFGPEALVAQLASRPASFQPWADFVVHLDRIARDCDDGRLAVLLDGQSSSAWQRAGYLLHAAGEPGRGAALLTRRPPGPMPKICFGNRSSSMRGDALWVAGYQLHDNLIAPLQSVLGKA